jgi:hypothetical protein
MGNLIPINQSRPPSKLLARKGTLAERSSASNFTDGVADSFPRLSIRGKAFWVQINGKELRAGSVDPNKGAIVDVVLVNASRQLAKTYYAKPFSSGDREMPDCWSLDSIRPDQSIVKPVNPTCQDCPKNAFNSAPSGRGGKACQDSKRVIVTTADQLANQEPLLLLMRLPQQSLKNLKNHVEKLAFHGYTEPYSCVSRMSFDMEVEFPKVQFDFVEPLTDEEFEAAEMLAGSKKVNDMLRNPDFDNAASDANAKHADDATTKLQYQKRLPQQGFTQAIVEQELDKQRADVSRETPAEETWEDLGDGTELNLLTGEVRDVPQQEEVLEPDDNVVKTSDGRFYNRVLKKFVDSPYKGAAPAPVSAPAKEAEAPKRTRRVKAKDVAEENDKKAAEAEAETKKAEPEQAHGDGNGADMPKPKVVAASPKLEALLGSLVPDEDQK